MYRHVLIGDDQRDLQRISVSDKEVSASQDIPPKDGQLRPHHFLVPSNSNQYAVGPGLQGQIPFRLWRSPARLLMDELLTGAAFIAEAIHLNTHITILLHSAVSTSPCDVTAKKFWLFFTSKTGPFSRYYSGGEWNG
jgi:hypothetical protein